LAARGDELLSQLRGTSSEPPEWATFDETPDPGPAGPNGSGRGLAAFDRVPEGSAGDPGESAAELAGTSAGQPNSAAGSAGTSTKARPTLVSAAETTIAPVKASRTRAAKAEAAKAARTQAPSTKAAGTKTAGTKAPSTKAAGTKTAGTKDTKATGTKATGSKPASSKPAKRTRTGAVSEPLAEAASRARPSQTPNPATMAAEIVQAQQATDAPTQPQSEAGSGTE
jgi:cobalamin biosynthesis Mg chelatase CobN